MSDSPRQKIIDKAAELFERQGYHATGLNQIVQESGTPRGSLYYYFPQGKEELAAEAVRDRGRDVQQNIRQRLAQSTDPAQAVYEFALSLAAYAEHDNYIGGAPFANVTLEASATSEQLRQTCRAAYWGISELFEQKLLDAHYEPRRAAQLATLITAALDGAIILSRADKTAIPLRHVAEELRALLQAAAPASR